MSARVTLGERLRADLEAMMEWRAAAGYAPGAYRHTLPRFIDYVGERWPDDEAVTSGMVDGWLAHSAYQSAASQAKFVSCLRILARFSNFLGRGDFVPGDEYSIRQVRYQPHLFTDAELVALFDALDSVSGVGSGRRLVPELVLPVWTRLLYCCGMRPQEPPSLLRADVDLESGDVWVRQAKRHRDRHLIVSPDMRRLMARYDDAVSSPGRTWFFERWDGGPYTTEWYWGHWRRAVDGCGVEWGDPRPRPYDLRHAFCSRVLAGWMDSGEDAMSLMPALSAFVGHAELDSTLYYVHLLPDRLRASPGVDWQSLNDVYGGGRR